jgi:hypothetical protein
MKPKCETCKFYRMNPMKTDRGECKRYPSPSLMTRHEVFGIDWCGEYQGETPPAHTCGDCGNELQIVRPGKYQCNFCGK